MVNKDLLSAEDRKKSDDQYRLALAAVTIVPWLLVPLFGFSLDGFTQSLAVKTPVDVKHPSRLVALVAILSIPHVYYAWVWTNNSTWSQLCDSRGLEPYKAFASGAHVIKGIQIAGMAWWVLPIIQNDPWKLVENIHPLKALLMLQLFGIGQLLNVQVYQKIGEAGVYYGTRLGKDIPWVYGFPFSIVPHAQYFGATLSFWATFLFLTNEQTVREGIFVLYVVMAFYYAFSSYAESYW